MSGPQVAVVVAFKDWGIERLDRCVRSILRSCESLAVEVIVVDYGSTDATSVRSAAERAGARCIRVETGGTWSRSRALNIGCAATAAPLIVSTDVDMIFAPGTLRRVVERLGQDLDEAIIIQCRDLPADFSVEDLDSVDWDTVAAAATLRPRWGMGGLVAIHREGFERLRGYDERMYLYGGEDIDFINRLSRWGYAINWLDEPDVRMYHVWHPSTSAAAARSPESRTAVAHNRRIYTEDKTTVRNWHGFARNQCAVPPIVSWIVAADEPRASQDGYVEEISSLLAQSVGDVEVLLAGDSGAAHRVADALDDCRVQVVAKGDQPWWRVAGRARGSYLLLQASGSLHGRKRLETLLAHTSRPYDMVADQAATLLQSDTVLTPVGSRSVPVTPFAWASVLVPQRLAARVLRTIPSPAVDPSELIAAALRNGGLIASEPAVGRSLLIPDDARSERVLDQEVRRVASLRSQLLAEGRQASWTDSLPDDQAREAVATATAMLYGSVDVTVGVSLAEQVEQVMRLVPAESTRCVQVTDGQDVALASLITASGLRLSALARLETALAAIPGAQLASAPTGPEAIPPDDINRALDFLRTMYDETGAGHWLVVQAPDGPQADRAYGQLERTAGLLTPLRRDLHGGEDVRHFACGLVANAPSALALLHAIRSEVPVCCSVDLYLAPGSWTSLASLNGGESRAV